ncbi:unnamed protein product [Heligmosomoides polygyrus]|uniref:Peptidase A1 domain-containing protein n=1 Tax=Heligmosomoides polygyrus TaxID=6339 RepID=A0A183GJU8_HELPZ|nr:unnamed protein product [Heligmosomoides polygyrus]
MHFTLALLALIGCAMAAVHRVQLTKVESQRTKMMRAGTWSRYIKMKNARRVSLEKRVNDYEDGEYIGNITIGTPEQQFQSKKMASGKAFTMFKVILDTGSANLWIPDATCGKVRESCAKKNCDGARKSIKNSTKILYKCLNISVPNEGVRWIRDKKDRGRRCSPF